LTSRRVPPYDAVPMLRRSSGNANLTAIVLLLGMVIASVWVWKRLSLETQEYIIDQAIPLVFVGALCFAVLWTVVRAVRKRKRRLRQRAKLLAAFEREAVREKKLETAFALIEVNEYRVQGLESAVPAMKELFVTTLQRAVGEKQHRIRGMAASHLGVLQDMSVVPLLVKALEDDHAYVRSCAALGLGRLRAMETKERLKLLMEEDWDQTVRSRAKEALERMRA
jgi:HEAT repeat protein